MIEFIEKNDIPTSCNDCSFCVPGYAAAKYLYCTWYKKRYKIPTTKPDFCKVRQIKILEET